MTQCRSLLLGVSILAIGQVSPVAIAQSNEDPAQSQEDYSDDPSYQAARRLLEVFAGAADNIATEEQREEEEDLSTDPWPDSPAIESWDNHYFIFQGENYVPILKSYVTPFVTLYSLEYGYTPVGKENKNCGKDTQHETVANGIAAETLAASEAAVVGDAAGALADARRYGCPNTLGPLWGSGSQVMDKDHNPLAEQWFPDGTKAIIAGDFPLHDENRYEGDDVADFLVVGSGGPERLGDPAIHPLPVPKMIVIDYPVIRRDGGEDGGSKQDDDQPKKPYISGVEELPITVFGRPIGDDNDGGLVDGPMHAPIDAITARIDQVLREREAEEFLIVHRGDPNLSEQIAADRLRAIREALNPHGNVKIVSFGQEMPVCKTADEHCWSMNRSTILYALD